MWVRIDQAANLNKERINGRSRGLNAKPAMHATMCNHYNAAGSALQIRVLAEFLPGQMCAQG
jgi:hypothetical protein